MNDTNPRKIVSRRSRPAKAPLSQEIIITTALDIMARDGLAGLSLRRIAAALDTGPASLYVYLNNLDELHALVLDRALAAVELPEDRGLHWRERLKGLLLSYLETLDQRNGLAQLALSTIATGPNSLRIWERILGLLKEAGVDDLRAAWGLDVLTLYVTAIAAEKSNWRTSGMEFGRVKNALSAVPENALSLLSILRNPLLEGDRESRTNWALDVIIDGIVGGRNTTSRMSRKSKGH